MKELLAKLRQQMLADSTKTYHDCTWRLFGVIEVLVDDVPHVCAQLLASYLEVLSEDATHDREIVNEVLPIIPEIT